MKPKTEPIDHRPLRGVPGFYSLTESKIAQFSLSPFYRRAFRQVGLDGYRILYLQAELTLRVFLSSRFGCLPENK
jgi:hypothetical protein